MNAFALFLLLVLSAPQAKGEWQPLAALPDKEGFAGAFAGVSGDALLVAGGANFPDKKPWEGGQKVWHDTVYLLDQPTGKWVVAGKLPRPLGYGVSVTHGGGVVCVGGSDAQRHYASAFRLRWQQGKLTSEPLPDLPQPMANSCGALVGDMLYVAGGLESPTSTTTLTTLYRLNLAVKLPRWETLKDCPGPGRMLAISAGSDGAFWLFGGTDLVAAKQGPPTRRYLHDAYRYDPRSGWRRITDLPSPVAAAASPAPHDATGFYLLGGDDGSQLKVEPTKHQGFRKTMLHYNVRANTWQEAATMPIAPVTLTAVPWRGGWVLPSGEVRPGVRTPTVWHWQSPLQER